MKILGKLSKLPNLFQKRTSAKVFSWKSLMIFQDISDHAQTDMHEAVQW